MGEYAEMMLDGTCCEGCGEYLGDGDGIPAYCSPECEPEGFRAAQRPAKRKPQRLACGHCNRAGMTRQGLFAHVEAKHPDVYRAVLDAMTEGGA